MVRIDSPSPAVRLLTLDRPDSLNAMTAELCGALHADEAERIGLVSEVVEEGALLERALEAAAQIGEWSPWGIRLNQAGDVGGARDPRRARGDRVRRRSRAAGAPAPARGVGSAVCQAPRSSTSTS